MDRSGLGRTTRRRWLTLLGAAGSVGLAGCSSSGRPQHYQDNEYIDAVGTDAGTLVSHHADDGQSRSAIQLTLDGAYAVTSDVEVAPLWMDLEPRDDEGRVYEAQLRDGLEWSDPYGQMTAEDWVYHIRNIHQGESNWAGSVRANDWAGITVERTGELSFEVELPEPNAEFPYEPVLWRASCYPRELIEPYVEDRDLEGFERDETINGLEYTGNLGPYRLERWDRDSEFVVVPNEDYYVKDLDDVPERWTEAPHFDGYRYRIIEEESTRLEALKNGEVTTAAIPPTRVREFRDEERVDVYVIPQPFLTVLAYNQRRNGWEPFRKRKVRQALSMAIDKTEIAENIRRGYAEVSHTFQPEWSEWYVTDEVRAFGEGDTYDPGAAREMLAEATGSDYGYDDDAFVGPDGEQVTLTFSHANTSEPVVTTAEFIAQELEDIGFAVELNGMSFKRLQSQFITNEYVDGGEPPWNAGPYNAGPRDRTESPGEWDLLYGVRFNTYPRTPASTESFWHERGSANFFGYVPEADMRSRFRTARRTVDPDERREILGEIFGILSEDQPVDFLVMRDDIDGYREYVDGPREEFGQSWNKLQTWRFG